MRSGETLIRLARHRIDSVQKLVMAAEQARADLARRLEDFDARERRERAAADADLRLGSTFVAFLNALKIQRANVQASIAGVEEQLEALRGDLQDAFEELKRFETLEEARKAREAKALAKRQQDRLDEAALIRAARR